MKSTRTALTDRPKSGTRGSLRARQPLASLAVMAPTMEMPCDGTVKGQGQ
jgi:hypothetical protein